MRRCGPIRTSGLVGRQLSFVVPVVFSGALTFGLSLEQGRVGPSGIVFAAIVGLNMALLAVSSWNGILGAGVVLYERCGGRIAGLAQSVPTNRARTAVLLPVCEEDPIRIFAAADVISDALSRERLGSADIFVMSDTQSALHIANEEAIATAVLAERFNPSSNAAPIYYRRRTKNGGRKAGNIAEFCERWGGRYDFMIVLDADSLMTGAAMSALVGAMEANPCAGMIQSMCYPCGRESLFARIQQFGARLNGPLLAKGAAFWQGPHASYWGHNAIIRMSAFAEHCGLPLLPGRAPLGGEILCHDTVEAALMLRGGWSVWLIPAGLDGALGGSWEELPTNLVDHLARDRRWCQGNLQHGALLPAAGLLPASLVHLGSGILHYLSAPLFVLFLTVSTFAGCLGSPGAGRIILGLALVLLFGPRVLALCHVLLDREASRRFGGRIAVVASALLDQAFSLVVGPVMLVFYTSFVLTTLAGRIVRWDRQVRDDRGLGWKEANACLGPMLALAFGLALLAAHAAPLAIVFIAPGLALGIPLAVWTSQSSLGRLAARARLFMIPEEVEPSELFARLNKAERRLCQLPRSSWSSPHALPDEVGRPIVAQWLRSRLSRRCLRE